MSGFRVYPLDDSPLWAVRAGYFSPKLNQVCRGVPGMRWDGAIKAHVGYTDAVEQVVARLRELDLKCDDPPVNKRSWKHNLPVSYDSAREYQKVGIDFLINQSGSGALLADDMGIGKTFQTIKAARALRRKTVIVCEAHVRGVWERPSSPSDKGGELAKWWPKAKIFAPYGVTPEPIPRDTDVFVTHYDIVYAWVDAVLAWSEDREAVYEDRDLTVVFDEAQMLLNPESRRSKACREIANRARGRIALTGTPPVEKIKDFHNVLNTISPGRFGETFHPYGLRYCDGKQKEIEGPEKTKKLVWDFGGRSNLKELKQRLDWFMLRRTKREVLKELPALQRQIVDVEVAPKNQIAMSARLIEDKKHMRAALDAAADGKFKSVVELVRRDLEAGQRVVVGTHRRAMCEKYAEALSEFAPTAFIHGGMSLSRRPKVIDKLRKTKGPVCLVANIDCTATGIDLTFAGMVTMAELVWVPRVLGQFESRVHRFGASESEPVLVRYVIARGTGDELILQGVINKIDNHLELIETDEGDGMKESLVGEEDEGLTRLAAALKKMGKKEKKK